jgi:hypothetical protein
LDVFNYIAVEYLAMKRTVAFFYRFSRALQALAARMRTLTYSLACGLIAFTMTACNSTDINRYSGETPELKPEQFFTGFITAHGVIKNFSGDVIRRFNADIDACWKDGVGTLDERFIFDDGERQTRLWTLTPNPDGSYAATAGDVIGTGTARWSGHALFLDYVLSVALDDSSIDLRIDDRMYRVDDNIVINESRMTKFGIGVGSILLTLIRHPEQPVTCPA